MTGQLDLIKKVELVLEKKGFKKDIIARVGLVLDESGSMSSMFQDGTVSRVVDRALAVGYKFDDNGEIDVWSFSNKVQRRDPASQSDYGSYLKHPMLHGSTLYHPVLEDVARFYFVGTTVTKSSFFGLRKTVEKIEGSDVPAFVIFITDGQPDNASVALREVAALLKDNPKMFVQFIGIGFSRFDVLERIVRENENSALATIEPGESDDSVLDKFLNEKARKVLEA